MGRITGESLTWEWRCMSLRGGERAGELCGSFGRYGAGFEERKGKGSRLLMLRSKEDMEI